MADITSFMSFFIDSFISMLTTIFNHLSNIQFMGISLLSYIIALFVLSVAVPLVITVINNKGAGMSYVPRVYRNARSSVERHVDSLGIGEWDIDE